MNTLGKAMDKEHEQAIQFIKENQANKYREQND